MFHVVEKDETLGLLAKKFGVTVAEFMAANPDIKNADLIRRGQRLVIPQRTQTSSSAEPEKVSAGTYMVRSGDSMAKIASHFALKTAELISANPQVADPRLIRPGELINIPGKASAKGVDLVTMPPKKGRPLWLVVAEREMATGIDEIPGTGNNPRILEYHLTTTLPGSMASQDETPWCSSFVNWSFVQAGIRGTNSAGARSWLKWGEPIDRPKRGAVTVFSRGSNQALGHVGFYWEQSGDRILVLGGNQGNQVSIKGYQKKDLLGFRWPGA
jgi:uncharacterized protein (TIGR02594 family)